MDHHAIRQQDETREKREKKNVQYKFTFSHIIHIERINKRIYS